MLCALNHQGKLISLYSYTLEALEKKRDEPYFCPICNERLQVRVGKKVIPHFAHYPKSNCSQSRGETWEHEKGKLLLFQWLKRQGYSVRMEHYLKEIQQRPDIYLEINQKRMAIEYQCSTIPIRQVESRTESYKASGIHPLWVLGMKHFNPKTSTSMPMNSFLRTFLYYFQDHYLLYFFDTNTNRMKIASNLHSLTPSYTTTYLHDRSLKNLRLPDLFSFKKIPFVNSNWRYWEKLMYTHRTQYRAHVNAEEREFRQFLYLKGLHFSLIPSICFIPLPGQITSEQPLYNWQTKLLVNHFLDADVGETVRLNAVYNRPTINGFKPDLVSDYLKILSELRYVRRNSHNEWVKLKHVGFYNNSEEAIKNDKMLLNILKK
ncbi:hypothetical protein LCL89_06975 [Halobacillus yeomjeoni]|uniref:competence protein CoiA n=1 Tax=Halobacillus yeomjeoni TaxID=311194 RepID=UPI001CD4458C|nr:competence protein CoiA family protein [Halobacillus yeomjeoni]MCA0983799.1 hypothetical protein [Halobacillus yeomjeoni]